MMSSFFKIAFRHLLRNRVFTFINLAGLTLGMTCALFAILFVKDEMGYDRFHLNAGRLYRLTTLITHVSDGTQQIVGTTGQVQGPAFKAAIPEIADYVRILGTDGVNLTGNNKSLSVKNIYADSSFFGMFSFPLVSGDAKTALTDPHSIVLSEKTALKFFGTTDVVGKILTIEEGRGIENLVVTGVAKNSPSNSSIQFDVLIPFSYLQLMFKDDNWLNQYLTTFILLEPGATPKTVEQKLSKVFTIRAKNQLAGSNLHPDQLRLGLESFTDIHLKPLALAGYGAEDNEEKGLSGASNIIYSYILSGIIGFILLMACVNFINLTIASSLKRAKEIGIRKIIGSSRKSIIIQSLIETALVCSTSYILAILSSKLLLPIFNQLSGKNISLSISENAEFLVYGAILMIGCIIIAGLYPAIAISLSNPLRSVTSKQKPGGKHYFGKSLIVFQFTLAIGLVVASCVYYYQMKFISSRDLGYNPHNVIEIHLPNQRMDTNVVQLFRNTLLMAPSVKGVAGALGIMQRSVIANGKELVVRTNSIDDNYLSTLEIPLREGRNFYSRNAADSVSVIVNEAFEKAAGLQHAVGHQLVDPNGHHPRTIIGVVRDYHYASLKEDIRPEVLNFGYTENILVKAQNGKDIQALSAISEAFNRIFSNHYFEYQFLDDENSIAYQADKKWEQIIFYAAGIAMIICCVGLFGLSIFVAQQRIKEIGIRKVLGASVAGITALMAKDFIKLVILAIVIAAPLAWLVMKEWLENFAYRIDIEWWMFALPAFISISIALFAISFQTIRTALANPIKSLRAE
jgi:putative ABC transport system permease protein